MKKYEFDKRVQLNGGCDRIINDWRVIDIHLIPEIMNEFHEIDFYCNKGKKVILLRLRNRTDENYTISESPEITYWIAELPINILDDPLIEEILYNFELM
ncbi:hypothetical protein [uncultured Apibacter sp.]|uniref:hypothetical protein n=1 Tax=uncultured Apibacter sp. TaxID=1778616 RepID=UPI0025E89D35|nr:hypothetical protein [uncultured Apibacter sp.]